MTDRSTMATSICTLPPQTEHFSTSILNTRRKKLGGIRKVVSRRKVLKIRNEVVAAVGFFLFWFFFLSLWIAVNMWKNKGLGDSQALQPSLKISA